MTAELITLVVGILTSILLEVIPKVKDKWAEWEYKPLTMLGASVVVGGGMWALVCLAKLDLKMLLDCSQQGIITALYLALVSFLGSQTTYSVGVRRLENVVSRQPGQ